MRFTDMILLVSPAAPNTVHGNGVTAQRWAGILRELGHEVRTAQEYPGGRYAALIALHARKSADAIRAFRAENPRAPIVLALTGTDLYPDLRSTGVEPEVLDLASRIVVLQEHGRDQLDSARRERCRVILQSVPPIERRRPADGIVEVAQLAHIRAVKDPLRAAAAVRLLPPDSRVHVTHVGSVLDSDLAAAAREESATNPRYSWLGERTRAQALDVLARSRLLVLASQHEGGANVISEAIAAGVPVISSAIPGSIGLLGHDYPGYFPAGDTESLADLLAAAESDRDGFYTQLARRCRNLRHLVDPRREHAAWADLLAELSLT
ncbi:selenoneine biosynthesis selenosugar synthase SenB [Haloechinothrix aidingensis]|uniref:selenoneine biosynthesis selenosugar synthase SenB n=1 Tax=Haloechinothrix aidingensis TaxID=2752311 RepID=UPI001C60B373